MKKHYYLWAIVANIACIVISLLSADISTLRITSLFQLVINTYYFLKGNSKFLSVGVVFFWLLYLFHCSRYVFLEDDGFDMVEGIASMISFRFVICCISAMCVGLFMTRSAKKAFDVSHSQVVLSDRDLLLMRKVSTYILIFTIIPFLYVDITRLVHTMTIGYGDIYHIGERDVLFKYFDPISHLFRPAVLLLMVSYCKKPKVATIILVIFISYSLIMMLSGARITALVYILSIIVIYVRFVLKRIKVSQFVLISLFTILILTVLPVLSSMRRLGVSRNDFREATSIVDEAGGNMNAAISEFGGSQLSVIYSIVYTSDFNYGRTYLASLLCISPKMPSFLDKTNLTYTQTFPNDITWGGSCIGEAYYNFGWLSILFFLLVGLLVGKMEYGLCRVSRSNLLTSIFFITLIPGLFTWVRDFFMIFVFTAFWIPVIFRIFMGARR